ncbi:protein-L-isoaspartate O-methyltransferase family protein [Thiolinea disciformis]|uniref:protein-L-isoaspartate O-methyltransferase family protein n=1 Tax=Thiolinea disciformis TaxID=125614 RepID=UPI00037F0793|nr:protein-L-isoaspartate O-methyltransferase [Thiolinea disciformis]
MNLDQARFNMVEQQIRPWEVLDQTVLDAFRFLPREKFVPTAWQNLAFADIEIPLDHGEFMMHPRVEARMLQELAIKQTDQCLEIGTGSGFVTACLARLGQHVDSVDIHSDFSKQAEQKLKAINITNFNLYNDNAAAGWEGVAGKLYDVIAVTGSVPEYVPAFEQRLAPGGRLFMVVGSAPTMHALLITRDAEGKLERRMSFELMLQALQGAEQKPSFQF